MSAADPAQNWWQRQLERYKLLGWITLADGTLWDSKRNIDLRPDTRWSYHHVHITSGSDLRATLRAGPWAWPGGYVLFFVTYDGEILCFDCVIKNLRRELQRIRDKDQERVIRTECASNMDPDPLYTCCDCNAKLHTTEKDDEDAAEKLCRELGWIPVKELLNSDPCGLITAFRILHEEVWDKFITDDLQQGAMVFFNAGAAEFSHVATWQGLKDSLG